MKSAFFGLSWICLCTCQLLAGSPLGPDSTFPNPAKHFEIKGIKKFKESDTILVPSLYLHLLVEGQYRQSNGSAHAKAKYAVTNASPDLGKELATRIYQDLIEKLTASGWKVLTYADTKDHPGWGAIDEIANHDDLGAPGFDHNFGHGKQTWMTCVPNGTFPAKPQKLGIPGSADLFKFHTKLARDLGANLLFPVFRFDAPVGYGSKSGGISRKSASAGIAPAMDLATIHSGFFSLKGAWGGVNTLQPVRVSENIGQIVEVDASKSSDVSLFTFQTFRSISKGDYQVTLNLDEYQRLILKAATDYNTILVEELKVALPNG